MHNNTPRTPDLFTGATRQPSPAAQGGAWATRANKTHALVNELLQTCFEVTRPDSGNHWAIALPGSPRRTGSAILTNTWLKFDVGTGHQPTATATTKRLVALLRRNSRFAGNVKYVIDPGGELHLAAELPADGPDTDKHSPLATSVVRASRGIATGLRIPAVPPAPVNATADGIQAARIADLCRTRHWETREVSSTRLEVTLPGGACAVIECRDEGPHLWSALQTASLCDLSPTCRHALALLLLQAGSTLCMARPSVAPATGAPRFDVCLPAQADAHWLHCALSSLSVAARLFFREAEAVARDECLAQTWLAGVSGPTGSSSRATGAITKEN